MLPNPADLTSLLIRTEYSDEDAWRRAYTALTRSYEHSGEYVQAGFTVVDTPALGGMDIEVILQQATLHGIPEVFIADRLTLEPDFSVVVVDCSAVDLPLRSFGVSAPWVWAVQNNLCLGNMDFEEFLTACDENGIFRGWSSEWR